MNVLSVASEIFPLVKTGGLADVVGSLPIALLHRGIQTRTLVPGYPGIWKGIDRVELIATKKLLGCEVRLLSGRAGTLDVLIADSPELYGRTGGPYLDQYGVDHADNWKRFAVLSMMAAEIAGGLIPGWIPDLVHAHDWQAGLTPVYMKYRNHIRTPTIITIHNLAFQGQFDARIFHCLDLPDHAFSINCLEYYGDVSFLKGGLRSADAITTVSPAYAREILTDELGMGLAGVLNERLDVLTGIVNGIDTDVWDPESDPFLPRNFNARSLALRQVNKAHMLQEFGIQDGGGPVFAFVSRLSWHKGVDVLVAATEDIVRLGGKLVVLGQGDHAIERELQALAGRFPGDVGFSLNYDERLAHLVHGGADALIQPSRFEPCGLTQLYALRYGCVPIVSRTGGLAETIIDANEAAKWARVSTGFQFHPVTPGSLKLAIRRAIAAFSDRKTWARLQTQGMKADFSWGRSADKYRMLYSGLVAAHGQNDQNYRTTATLSKAAGAAEQSAKIIHLSPRRVPSKLELPFQDKAC